MLREVEVGLAVDAQVVLEEPRKVHQPGLQLWWCELLLLLPCLLGSCLCCLHALHGSTVASALWSCTCSDCCTSTLQYDA